MSVTEICEQLRRMTAAERARVQEELEAIQAGLSVEEMLEIEKAIAQGEREIDEGRSITLAQAKKQFGL